MDTDDVMYESVIPGLPLIGRGKVRDIYSVDDDHLLIVTTDRLSAYDVVMPDPIPGKGEVLTRFSLFWFRMMHDVIDNQLTEVTVADVVPDRALQDMLRNRALVVKRLKPLPIEAVVRGYLELRGGYGDEVVEVAGPVIVTVSNELGTPRYPTMQAKLPRGISRSTPRSARVRLAPWPYSFTSLSVLMTASLIADRLHG